MVLLAGRIPSRIVSAACWGIVAGSLVVVFASGGCHMAFDGELGNIGCTQNDTYGPPACPEKQTCVAGRCSEIGAPPGVPCLADGDCRPGSFCFDPAIIGVDSGPYCSRGCCDSGDCGAAAQGQVCWPLAPGKVTVCQPAVHLGRDGLGSAKGGQECAEHSSCRSGRCIGQRCIDTCCEAGSCPVAKDVCRSTASDGWADGVSKSIWACMQPSGSEVLAAGAECENNADCEGAVCVKTNDEASFEGFCAAPCCGSVSCGWIGGASGLQPVACAAIGDGLTSCSRLLTPEALGTVGDPCEDGETCRSGECITDNVKFVDQNPKAKGFCTDICCSDEDCGDPEQFVCRPLEAGKKKKGVSWSLRCVLK